MTPARLLERLRSTFWSFAAISIAFAIAAGLALPALDDSLTLPGALSFNGSPDTARAVLQMIATVAVTVAGISFSVIVVALVLASQQLSPRVMRSFQRHPLNQSVLALFLGTAAFSLFVLSAVEDAGNDQQVPEASITVAMALAALSLGLFVVFLHHMVRSLNASAVIRRIAAEGHEAIQEPYPTEVGTSPPDPEAAEARVEELTGSPPHEVRAPRAGYLASVAGERILAAAERRDGFVEQVLAIGDFAVTGGLLARVWCPEAEARELTGEVKRGFDLNEERIVDGDSAFLLRQLVDVALKGLSPGINDPTTAENAMDSVADSLVRFARQPEPAMLRLAPSGAPRLRAAAPSLDDLVKLGFDQVRRDGAGRPSFAVRLLEMLGDLRELGGPRARECEEVLFQARALRDHAIALAEVPEDEELVRSAYEALLAPSGMDIRRGG